MEPIYQKLRSDKVRGIKGDCLRACICSLLEISDECIPNFVDDENYPEKLLNFLKQRKLSIYHSDTPPDQKYYMAWGISPRGIKHSVIYSNGKIVHDPHPDGGGVKDIYNYAWIEKDE
jgi:hypothetical protein